MEKEIVEVDMAMLTKMIDNARLESSWAIKDSEQWAYWHGYRIALTEVLEGIEREKDE